MTDSKAVPPRRQVKVPVSVPGDSTAQKLGTSQQHGSLAKTSVGFKPSWSTIVKSECAKNRGPGNGVQQCSPSTPSSSTTVSFKFGKEHDIGVEQNKKNYFRINKVVEGCLEVTPEHGGRVLDGERSSAETWVQNKEGVGKDSKPNDIKQVWKKQAEETNFGIPLAETGVLWPSLSDSRDQPLKKRGSSLLGGNVKYPDILNWSGQPSGQQSSGDDNQEYRGSKGKGNRGLALRLEARGQVCQQGPKSSHEGHLGPRSSRNHSGMSRDARHWTGGRRNESGSQRRGSRLRGTFGQAGPWGRGLGRTYGSQSDHARSPYVPWAGNFGVEPYIMQIPPNMGMVYMPMIPLQMFYPSGACAMPGFVGGYPGPSAVTRQQIMEAVMKQIEYYFSVENLCKDIFLRSRMDENGWIPLNVISNFNRVQMLTSDHRLVVEALQKSHIVEISPDNKMVRPCGCFNQWILPFQQKNAAHIYSQTVGSAVNTVESTNEIPSVSKGGREDDALSLVEEHASSHLREAVGDDDMELTDEELERLCVVTQKHPSESHFHCDKGLASLISDGLACYEQELQQNYAHDDGKPSAAGMSRMHFYSSSLPKSIVQGHKGWGYLHTAANLLNASGLSANSTPTVRTNYARNCRHLGAIALVEEHRKHQ